MYWKLTALILITGFFSCETKVNNTISQIEIADSCNKIQLADSLYLGFRHNMTKKQYYEYLNDLISNNGINASDTTVILNLPDYSGNMTEIKLNIRPIFDDCYLQMIILASLYNNPPVFIAGIDNIMIEKYGRGVDSGFNTLDIYEMTSEKVNNNNKVGTRVWKKNGIQINLSYDNSQIEIKYQSIKYLNKLKIREQRDIKLNDSVNQTKINENKKSI